MIRTPARRSWRPRSSR